MHRIDIGDVRTWEPGGLHHACLCDPPYSLKFMGKSWDDAVAFQPETWVHVAEYLHPGAFLMAFGSTRGYHRMACAIEDAGFIIHPAIGWVQGAGFPKATRIDTQVDKAAGASERRQVLGPRVTGDGHVQNRVHGGNGFGTFEMAQDGYDMEVEAATPLGRTWAGHRYGLQALKPAFEFVCVAQKPYVGKPVACITRTGAGALNVDGGRIGTPFEGTRPRYQMTSRGIAGGAYGNQDREPWDRIEGRTLGNPAGRWPPNLALVDAADVIDEQSGERPGSSTASLGTGKGNVEAFFGCTSVVRSTYPDMGGASRYFPNCDWSYEIAERIGSATPVRYCAKAGRKERDAGLEGMAVGGRPLGISQWKGQTNGSGEMMGPSTPARNGHPTVKPISLCKWLATLLLPPSEYAPRRILVPFLGSGSEAIGAGLAGWEEIVGCEQSAEYADIARARLRYWLEPMAQMAAGG